MRLIRKIRSKKDSKVLAMIEKANLFKRYVFLHVSDKYNGSSKMPCR